MSLKDRLNPKNIIQKDNAEKEIEGFGVLSSLISDNDINYIMVNDPKNIYIEKNGTLYKTKVFFKDNEHLKTFTEKLVAKTGFKIDEKTPVIEVKLADGIKLNAACPPVAVGSCCFTIKRFNPKRINIEKLLELKTLTFEIADFLKTAIALKLNILISGSVNSGKTSLLNALCSYIPKNERIATVEKFSQLKLQQQNIIAFEAKAPDFEGKGEVTIKSLLLNALKMRPERIILGEIEEDGAFEFLKAANSGYKGILSTIYAQSPQSALQRLTEIISQSENISPEIAEKQVLNTVDLIVHIEKLPDGTRKITSVCELCENNDNKLKEIFSWRQSVIDNLALGVHFSNGVKPSFLKLAQAKGYDLNGVIFDEDYKHIYHSATQIKKKQPEKAIIEKQENNNSKNIFKKLKK